MVTESPGINSHTSNLADARKPMLAIQQPVANTAAEKSLTANQPNATNTQASVSKSPASVLKSNETNAQLNAPANAQQEAEQEDKPSVLSPDELRGLLDEINNSLYSMNRALRFEINDTTEDLVVRVINTDTDQVIHQYPSEEVIKRKERLLEGEVSGFSVRVD